MHQSHEGSPGRDDGNHGPRNDAGYGGARGGAAGSLSALVQSADPLLVPFFQKLITEVGVDKGKTLGGMSATADTLADLLQDYSVSSAAALYSGYLLHRIKQGEPRIDIPKLEDRLLREFFTVDDPHRKHCISLALQGSSPRIQMQLLHELSSDIHGDFAAVALRGEKSKEVLEQLAESVRCLNDKPSLSARAISALFGSSEREVREALHRMQPSDLERIVSITSSHERISKPILQHRQLLAIRTIPFSYSVLDNYEGSLPIGLVDDEIGECIHVTSHSRKHHFSLSEGDYQISSPLQIDVSTAPFLAPLLKDLIARDSIQREERERQRAASRVDIDTAEFLEANVEVERRDRFCKGLARRDDAPIGKILLFHPKLEPFVEVLLDRQIPNREGAHLGELVQILADPKVNNQEKHAAARLLQVARYCTALGEGEFEDVALNLITGRYAPYSKHAAALSLQGSRNEHTLKQLAELFQDEELGDYAAVALRSPCHPIASEVLTQGFKSGDATILERACLSALYSEDVDVALSLLKLARTQRFLQNESIQGALNYFANTPVGARVVAHSKWLERLLAVANDEASWLMIHETLSTLRRGTGAHHAALRATFLDMPIAREIVVNGDFKDSFIVSFGNTRHPLLLRRGWTESGDTTLAILSPAHGAALPIEQIRGFLRPPFDVYVTVRHLIDQLF